MLMPNQFLMTSPAAIDKDAHVESLYLDNDLVHT